MVVALSALTNAPKFLEFRLSVHPDDDLAAGRGGNGSGGPAVTILSTTALNEDPR